MNNKHTVTSMAVVYQVCLQGYMMVYMLRAKGFVYVCKYSAVYINA